MVRLFTTNAVLAQPFDQRAHIDAIQRSLQVAAVDYA